MAKKLDWVSSGGNSITITNLGIDAASCDPRALVDDLRELMSYGVA